MYINEKSFEDTVENKYEIRESISQLVELLYTLSTDYRLTNIYYCGNDIPRWNSFSYPYEKWLSDPEVDRDLKRQWMNLVRKINLYEADTDYSFVYQDIEIAAGAEAILEDSCIISFASDKRWLSDSISGNFISLNENGNEVMETEKSVYNLWNKKQASTCEMLTFEPKEEVESYEQMWNQKEIWFPNLEFCPSVKKNLKGLEVGYIQQVWKRLSELNEYARLHGSERFDATLLKHVSPESDSTLKMYEKEHTFCDEREDRYLFSWHSRFTGVEGRVFFYPRYRENKILIGYIGKKLKNVSYPT